MPSPTRKSAVKDPNKTIRRLRSLCVRSVRRSDAQVVAILERAAQEMETLEKERRSLACSLSNIKKPRSVFRSSGDVTIPVQSIRSTAKAIAEKLGKTPSRIYRLPDGRIRVLRVPVIEGELLGTFDENADFRSIVEALE